MSASRAAAGVLQPQLEQAFPYHPAMTEYPCAAKRHITALIESLRPVVQRHPNQMVDASIISILRVVLDTVKDDMPDNPIIAVIVDRYWEAAGESVRADSLLLVAQQLDAAIGDAPPTVA
jgi:hypothetical protein